MRSNCLVVAGVFLFVTANCFSREAKPQPDAAIVLSQEEKAALSNLWGEARELLSTGRPEDDKKYTKEVVPKWRRYGAKAALFAIEKLKEDDFAPLDEFDRGRVRQIVGRLLDDAPRDSRVRVLVEKLKGKEGNGYYVGYLIICLMPFVSYEICETLMGLADDKRPATRAEPCEEAQQPRVCDWACYFVIDRLGLQSHYPNETRETVDRDKDIEKFKAWWTANKATVRKKLKGVPLDGFVSLVDETSDSVKTIPREGKLPPVPSLPPGAIAQERPGAHGTLVTCVLAAVGITALCIGVFVCLRRFSSRDRGRGSLSRD